MRKVIELNSIKDIAAKSQVDQAPGNNRRKHRGKAKPKSAIDAKLLYSIYGSMVEALSESPVLQKSFSEAAKPYIDNFIKLAKHKGIAKAVSMQKESWNYVKIIALGGKPKPVSYWEQVDRRGHPKSQSEMIALMATTPKLTPYILTICSLHLSVERGHPAQDISDIWNAEDTTTTEQLTEFRQFLEHDPIFQRLRDAERKQSRNVYVTSSNGIYGKAFYSASLEREILLERPEAFKSIIHLLREFDREYIAELLEFSHEYSSINIEEKYRTLRRFTSVPEKGHKWRNIVISDFWTQNALYGIHNHTMDLLKLIPEDATFSATEQFNYLTDRLSNRYFDCYDLKSFTDNLPLSLQRVVVEMIYGNEVEESWTALVRERILGPDLKFFTFGKGQPMGLLSSWAVATLTHHLLVRWAGHRCNLIDKSVVFSRLGYCLLGDDIVVYDRTLSRGYSKLINELKIPEAKQKFVSSKRGFEFTKRLMRDNIEITPFTWNSLTLTPVDRYLDIAETLTRRRYIDRLSMTFLRELQPTFALEIDHRAFWLYVSVTVKPEISGYHGPTKDGGNKWFNINKSRHALSMLDIEEVLYDLIMYDPRKHGVKMLSSVCKDKVKDLIDPVMFILYEIVKIQILMNSAEQFRRFSKKLASNLFGQNIKTPHPVSDFIFVKERKYSDFYKPNSSSRFSAKRVSKRRLTINTIKTAMAYFDFLEPGPLKVRPADPRHTKSYVKTIHKIWDHIDEVHFRTRQNRLNYIEIRINGQNHDINTILDANRIIVQKYYDKHAVNKSILHKIPIYNDGSSS